MDVMFVLIGFSLLVALGFLAAFFWALKSGQFDDVFTPAMRVLFDNKNKDNNKNDDRDS